MSTERFWYFTTPDDIALPVPESIIGWDKGGESPLLPIIDEEYGGVIAWTNTEDQARRIVNALRRTEG